MKTRKVEDVLARIAEIVNIKPDLDIEFKSQAANYSWLSSYYVEAKDQVRRLKNELEMIKAGQMDKARKFYQGERATKDMLEGWVIRTERYQETMGLLLDAQLTEDQLTAGIRALDYKRDSLMSLGANMRREITENIRELTVRGVRQ